MYAIFEGCALIATIDELKCTIDELKCTIDELKCTIDELKCTIDELKCTIDELKCTIDELKCTIDELKCTIDELKCTIDELKCTIDELKCTIDELKCTIDELKCTIDELKCTIDELKCTIDELKCTIDFLKNELEEENLHIRSLLLWDANDGRKVDMFLLEKSKSSTAIKASYTLNSILGPPNVNTPTVGKTHESSIIRKENPSNKQVANGENGNGLLCTNGDVDEINSDVNGEFNDFNNNSMHTDAMNISETILSISDYEHSDVNYDASYKSDNEYFQELYNKFRETEIKKMENRKNMAIQLSEIRTKRCVIYAN